MNTHQFSYFPRFLRRAQVTLLASLLTLGSATAQSHEGHDHAEEAAHAESHDAPSEHDAHRVEGGGHEGHGHAEEAMKGESHAAHAGHDDHAAEPDSHDHAERAAHGESHEAHAEHDDHAAHDEGAAKDGHDEHAGEGDEHEGEGAVQLTPEVRAEFGIELGQAGSGTLQEKVVLPGEIRFNRAAIAYATPRYEGTVQDIRVRLAERVKKGDVLATLESVETLRPFEIKAPLDGVIVSYDITPGQTVAAGTSLFTVADLSTVWADLQIYQTNFGQVQEGQSVLISGGHNLPTFQGVIDYVAPTVDEHTRTGLARIVVDNPDRAWKPGMFIQGRVSVEEHPVKIMVPRSAVLTVENASAVFVQTAEGFEPRPIEIGHSDSEFLQVLRGLQAGETYITKNPISIKAEMGKGSFGGHNH